jgi:hypothetical protein
MRILVIGSCTGFKHDHGCPAASKLVEDDFANPIRLKQRESELRNWLKPAAEMYTGRQHTQMMDGVRIIRSSFGEDACSVGIVSAGYGVIEESRRIAPYDITFQGMPKPLIRSRGDKLHIPDQLRKVISEFSLTVFLLGDDYLRSARPPIVPIKGQRFIYFGSPRLRECPNGGGVVLPAAQPEATEFGDGVVSLKGRMFFLLAAGLRQEPTLFNDLLLDETASTTLRLIRLGAGRA